MLLHRELFVSFRKSAHVLLEMRFASKKQLTFEETKSLSVNYAISVTPKFTNKDVDGLLP